MNQFLRDIAIGYLQGAIWYLTSDPTKDEDAIKLLRQKLREVILD